MSSNNTTNSTSANVINWFEIPVANVAKATALYEAMLNTKLQVSTFDGSELAMLMPTEKTKTAGCLITDRKRPKGRSYGPVLYLNAPDGVARCVHRALEAGAKVVQPATPIDPHGIIALIEDLDGNVIGLHEEPAR